MDKIDNIRTEIEQLRRKVDDHNYYLDNSEQAVGYVNALLDIENFLDTLSEELDKSLEEAAEDYARLDNEGVWKDGGKYNGFIAGANWQKSQMLKGAVEGEVITNGLYPYEPRIVAPYPNCPYAFGDKVRIVILKEEEE